MSESEDAIKAIEARRAERKKTIEEARLKQLAIDLDAFDKLEVEHGENRVERLYVKGFVPGLPTMIVIKSPGGTSFYNRYKDQARRANKNAQAIGAAQEMLGEACIIYPSDDDVRKRMLAEFPGAAISAGVRAIAFVELEADDEKKG